MVKKCLPKCLSSTSSNGVRFICAIRLFITKEVSPKSHQSLINHLSQESCFGAVGIGNGGAFWALDARGSGTWFSRLGQSMPTARAVDAHGYGKNTGKRLAYYSNNIFTSSRLLFRAPATTAMPRPLFYAIAEISTTTGKVSTSNWGD